MGSIDLCYYILFMSSLILSKFLYHSLLYLQYHTDHILRLVSKQVLNFLKKLLLKSLIHLGLYSHEIGYYLHHLICLDVRQLSLHYSFLHFHHNHFNHFNSRMNYYYHCQFVLFILSNPLHRNLHLSKIWVLLM